MIPIEQLRESSFYQYIVKEGLKEGREKGLKLGLKRGERKGLQQGLQQGRERLVDLLKLLVVQRFPRLQLGSALDAIQDLAVLQELCLAATTTRGEKAFLKKNKQAAATQDTTENGTNKK